MKMENGWCLPESTTLQIFKHMEVAELESFSKAIPSVEYLINARSLWRMKYELKGWRTDIFESNFLSVDWKSLFLIMENKPPFDFLPAEGVEQITTSPNESDRIDERSSCVKLFPLSVPPQTKILQFCYSPEKSLYLLMVSKNNGVFLTNLTTYLVHDAAQGVQVSNNESFIPKSNLEMRMRNPLLPRRSSVIRVCSSEPLSTEYVCVFCDDQITNWITGRDVDTVTRIWSCLPEISVREVGNGKLKFQNRCVLSGEFYFNEPLSHEQPPSSSRLCVIGIYGGKKDLVVLASLSNKECEIRVVRKFGKVTHSLIFRDVQGESVSVQFNHLGEVRGISFFYTRADCSSEGKSWISFDLTKHTCTRKREFVSVDPEIQFIAETFNGVMVHKKTNGLSMLVSCDQDMQVVKTEKFQGEAIRAPTLNKNVYLYWVATMGELHFIDFFDKNKRKCKFNLYYGKPYSRKRPLHDQGSKNVNFSSSIFNNTLPSGNNSNKLDGAGVDNLQNEKNVWWNAFDGIIRLEHNKFVFVLIQ